MPIDSDSLDRIVGTFAAAMTSTRGRRVHRLLMREFSRFDDVLAVAADDGAPALLALADDGAAALCRTDGRGATVEISHWATLRDATVTTRHDLTKDSLPIVAWTIRHPGFSAVGGTVTVLAAGLSNAECSRLAVRLRMRPLAPGGKP